MIFVLLQVVNWVKLVFNSLQCSELYLWLWVLCWLPVLDTHSSSEFVWNESGTGAQHVVIMYLRAWAKERLEV